MNKVLTVRRSVRGWVVPVLAVALLFTGCEEREDYSKAIGYSALTSTNPGMASSLSRVPPV